MRVMIVLGGMFREMGKWSELSGSEDSVVDVYNWAVGLLM